MKVFGISVVECAHQSTTTTTGRLVLCKPGVAHEFTNTSRTQPLVLAVMRTSDPFKQDMIWENQPHD